MCQKHIMVLTFKPILLFRSDGFRPVYARLHELRAIVPFGVPLLAATAAVTKTMRDDIVKKLDMKGCELVCASPNRPNIYYEVRCRTNIQDMEHLVGRLRRQGKMAERVIIYCRSLDMCTNLYEHFLLSLGNTAIAQSMLLRSVTIDFSGCFMQIQHLTIRT